MRSSEGVSIACGRACHSESVTFLAGKIRQTRHGARTELRQRTGAGNTTNMVNPTNRINCVYAFEEYPVLTILHARYSPESLKPTAKPCIIVSHLSWNYSIRLVEVLRPHNIHKGRPYLQRVERPESLQASQCQSENRRWSDAV